MRIIVDTRCWLWLQGEPERLHPRVLDRLAESGNELLLSAASAWEIAIKHALGKLRLPQPPARYVPSRMSSSGTSSLPVTQAHALQVSTLPLHHRDPFDRLLIAQAQIERIPILTADPQFAAYDVKLLGV